MSNPARIPRRGCRQGLAAIAALSLLSFATPAQPQTPPAGASTSVTVAGPQAIKSTKRRTEPQQKQGGVFVALSNIAKAVPDAVKTMLGL